MILHDEAHDIEVKTTYSTQVVESLL